MITGPGFFVLGLTLAALVLFIWDRWSPDVVAVGILVALVFGGILGVEEAVEGFANEALLAVGALFILSQGLIRTGVVGYLSLAVAGLSRGNVKLILPVTLVIVAVCSAFLNNTPVVVLFVPIMLGLAEQHGLSASKLLIPLSFASIVGGTCTLFGTSTNILINTFSGGEAGLTFEPLGMFEFLPLGLVFSGIGLIYLVVFSLRALPDRRTVATLTAPGTLTEYVTEIRIRTGSRSIGKTVERAILKRHPKLKVVELIRGEEIIWNPSDVEIEARDILIVMGAMSRVAALQGSRDVQISQELRGVDDDVRVTETTLAEVVLPPDSGLVGRTLQAAKFRERNGVSVIAIQRQGFHFRKKISEMPLRAGDLLLVQGEPEGIEHLRKRRDFLLLEGAGQPVIDNRKAPLSAAIFLVVVALAALGIWPISILAIAGALLMIATRCLSTQSAYRSINWEILFLIAGMVALGRAMEVTGVSRTMAGWVADATVLLADDVRPYVVLSAFYLLINIFSNVISHNATALLFVPVVLETAVALDVSARPFLFCVAFAASAAFSLPIGYATHLIVYGAGGYKMTDFFKFGTPLAVLCWIAASILMPVFWPF